MAEHIELIDHVGKQPVHDSHGEVISVVETPTGLRMVVHVREDEGGRSQRQIGFLHPNKFLHFIIPQPPSAFVDWVKSQIEGLIEAPVLKVGAPPSAEPTEDE